MISFDKASLLSVFPATPLPSVVEEVSIYPEDSADAVAGYVGRRWDEVEDEVLFQATDAFIYFTPEAYRYYIPALVYYFSEGKPYTETIGPIFTALLRSPYPENWEYRFTDRWSGFSVEQLEVLRAFMSILEADYSAYEPEPSFPQAMDILDTLILLRMYEDD